MQLIDESNETTQQIQSKQQQQQSKMDKFYPPKPKINAFNDLFTCYLCQGYMINPTTIDVCMHTYCRSCIARHLAVDCYCPQCKGVDSKAITISNLKSDDILRSIIFKLVPGLYQKERDRLVQFVNNTKNEGNQIASTEQSLNELLESEDDFFSPTDPISLSLEFHPVLAEQCPEGTVPPVRYLQCPASVKVQHLKRFLCSKFNINPCNKRVGIDIIYEDEILPSDFTLMDVGYCYKWQRHVPMKLTYRILIYNEDMPLQSDNDCEIEKSHKSLATGPTTTKTVSLSKENSHLSPNNDEKSMTASVSSPSQVSKTKSLAEPSASLHLEVPVKVTISRKSSEGKKLVSKKSSSTADEFVVPTTTTNDFKSLRSNDIRFSDYAITSSTNTTNNSTVGVKKDKSQANTVKEEKPKCDIVVSIPHNQMQEEWESKPLSKLKMASKKSPNSTSMEVATPLAPPTVKKVRNVPKLKIELNSLKTKLIEKPKSADIRLDTLMIKHHRPRKFSLDEPQPVVDKVDLETYVKNIGLKPIEIQTSSTSETEVVDKFTPNASPMSSSSSTTSSSTGNFNFNGSADITSSSSSSSSHKKRKKKHSKESRESKDSKRKKMHAEISSHSAEESLKMKVKLTPPINLKSLKIENKKSPPIISEKTIDPLAFEKPNSSGSKTERKEFCKPKHSDSKDHEQSKDKSKSRSMEIKTSKSLGDKMSNQESKKLKELEDKSNPLEIKIALSNNSGKSLTKEFDDDEDLTIPDSTSLGLSKPLATIKETQLPHSPPLPPSLFKTTPLTFSTFSPNVTTMAKPKPVVMPKDSKDKPKTPQMKPIAPKPMAPKLLQPSTFKTPHFAVPNPPRFMASNIAKFLSTPTSIASAANKHMGNLLKRSISVDKHKSSGPQNKQQRLEKPNQITVSAYSSNLHMTKVEIPATLTSSNAKATYEIPLYSPLSASYNPKCSFSVNSTTVASKTAKVSLLNTLSSTTSAAQKTVKQAFNATVKATNKTDVDDKKITANDFKPSDVNTTSNMANNKATTNTTICALMGPPKPIQKLNSNLNVMPKSPPLKVDLPFASTSLSTSTPTSTTIKITPQHTTAVLSTASLSMVNYRQSKVLLAQVKPTNLPDIKIETTTTATTAATPTVNVKTTVVTTNGLTAEKHKTSSLREFRLPSRESVPDILDLSASTMSSTNGVAEKLSTNPSSVPTSTISSTQMTICSSSTGSTLEMTLNKIKQNMSTTTTTTMSHIPSISNSTLLDNVIKKPELATSSSSPISDDLQNLHLLSESATAREKIAISTSSSTPTSSSTSLYEKAKITQNTLVRQQNASVRNIPNPSALAFRNQQPATVMPPMVTIAAGVANKLNDPDIPLLLNPSPPKSPHSVHCSTSSSTSPSRNMNKKHPSIDQVAASLNMRASAAAEASAKAHSKLNDETALVTSTSSVEYNKIKKETAEMVPQNDGSTVQPSSTVNICPLVNINDIKKEPEEKVDDGSDMKVTFVNTTSKKSSIVENLVTSVINVTTPTSTLLTAANSAGF